MKLRWDDTRSTVPPKKQRLKRIALRSGLTVVVCCSWLLPYSCKEGVRGVSVDVIASVIAPQVTKAVNGLGSALFPPQDRPAVGVAFATDLVRKHFYWCDVRESEQVCIDRIAHLAAADFKVTLVHWYQSIRECRQDVIDRPTGAPSDEVQMIDEIFTCLERRGFQRQIEALRASESRGT